ncbi:MULTISPECIES: shikimate kinase [unclassified Bacillus (in: firmicutes)]|uniref:shikimate kinase n=1 Tax=unclassified Bacillus (in: firmicutes) TaxID=185979 RepID=UPI0008E0D810|nr:MULTISPECIES: shikimate kinase [unclassified Bacillus (in: firmicutes)]SFI48438.1 shikimate kinase [Bacillus sp. 71mf]SFS49602.1 shikimate kinase [Bacillus sp. 103mf]
MKALYITGFMGSGKTTVGKALSSALHMPVIDTDQCIEEKTKKIIRDIFSEEGEGVFRKYESEVLQLLPTNDYIITTGGGIVEKAENREWMKERGTVIYLYCDPYVIAERIAGDTTRPLFQKENIGSFIEKFEKRQVYYEEATVKIDTTNKSIEAIVQEIQGWITK